jgi:hypothetical protein
MPPFDPAALKTWSVPHFSLPLGLPDFDKGSTTLGAGGEDRFTRWRLATAIIRSENGWGSGAFVSANGWLLSNYHVVAGAAQRAAAAGETAVFEVITARAVGGRIKPGAALRATLYRVDPVRDLALLKLEAMPADGNEIPCFPLADQVREGEDCFVIGSQNNGPAWWVRSGNVSQQLDFPEDLRRFAAGAAGPGGSIDRGHATVVVTDARVSPGDSGGPLLNARGELIGLTFATSANRGAGSVGWHIALQHLRTFMAELPDVAEGVPFDAWTAGVPQADMLEPELADGDGDGRIDSLRYRYAIRAGNAPNRALSQPAALTIFVDFSQRANYTHEPFDRIPAGLWGMENVGRFQFEIFLTIRTDGLAAVGYTRSEGIVDEIRIGRSRQYAADIVWRQDRIGKWQTSRPSSPTPLIDPARVGLQNMRRLQNITGNIVAAQAQQGPLEKGVPNKR